MTSSSGGGCKGLRLVKVALGRGWIGLLDVAIWLSLLASVAVEV